MIDGQGNHAIDIRMHGQEQNLIGELAQQEDQGGTIAGQRSHATVGMAPAGPQHNMLPSGARAGRQRRKAHRVTLLHRRREPDTGVPNTPPAHRLDDNNPHSLQRMRGQGTRAVLEGQGQASHALHQDQQQLIKATHPRHLMRLGWGVVWRRWHRQAAQDVETLRAEKIEAEAREAAARSQLSDLREAMLQSRAAVLDARDEADALSAEALLAWSSSRVPQLPSEASPPPGAGLHAVVPSGAASAPDGLELVVGILREFAVAARMNRRLQASRRKVMHLMRLVAEAEDAIATAEAQHEVLRGLLARHKDAEPALALLSQLGRLRGEVRRLSEGLEAKGTREDGGNEQQQQQDEQHQHTPQGRQQVWKQPWWPFTRSKSRQEEPCQTTSEPSMAAACSEPPLAGGAGQGAGDARTAHTHALLLRLLDGWEGPGPCDAKIRAGKHKAGQLIRRLAECQSRLDERRSDTATLTRLVAGGRNGLGTRGQGARRGEVCANGHDNPVTAALAAECEATQRRLNALRARFAAAALAPGSSSLP